MFERFTPEARHVVVRAQEVSRDLGHTYIGTEHILLGLLHTDDGLPAGGVPAADALHAVGITEDKVHDLVIRIVGEGEGSPTGHIPFTPRSKKTLELSLREALRLKHKDIRPEHILLGIIREGQGVAAQVLCELGADLPRLRDDVLQRMPGTAAATASRLEKRLPGPIRATPAGAALSNRALAKAGEAHVASHHYLLALLDDEDSVAARALANLGVTRAAVHEQLAQLSPDGTSDELPEHAGARRTSLQVLGDTIAIRLEESELAARLRPHFERLKTDVLRGRNLPGSDRLWRAVMPAVEEAVRDLDAPHDEWTPPGWSTDGIACYSMTSRPEGYVHRLWLAPTADAQAVRAFLATYLGAAPAHEGDAVHVTASVGAAGEGRMEVTHFGYGAGSAPPEWPRVPFPDLVAAAIADLKRSLPISSAPPPEGAEAPR